MGSDTICEGRVNLGQSRQGTILRGKRQLQEQDELCACEFVACCRVAQPTVSHHLKVLREAGLVRAERRGQWIYYRLNRERLAALRGWLP